MSGVSATGTYKAKMDQMNKGKPGNSCPHPIKDYAQDKSWMKLKNTDRPMPGWFDDK